MTKIYTLTPNPALDLSGHVSRIVPNEKNYVTRARLDPGGNAINAARIAKRLGASPLLLGFAGGGTGTQLRALLSKEGLRHQFTAIREATRTNVTVTNDQDHEQTRLTFPGPKVSPKEIRSLRASIARFKAPGIFVLGGSAPNDCSHRFYPDLIASASKHALGVIVDVPSVYLKTILNARSVKFLLLKPNQTELEELLGRKFRSDKAIADAALKLTEKSAIVCVSLANRGAVFAANGETWFARAPRVKARGTVGAGDSMVGAMATRLAHWGLSHPDLFGHATTEKLLDIFRWGLAAGAATATTEGTKLGELALIRRLCTKVLFRKP